MSLAQVALQRTRHRMKPPNVTLGVMRARGRVSRPCFFPRRSLHFFQSLDEIMVSFGGIQYPDHDGPGVKRLAMVRKPAFKL